MLSNDVTQSIMDKLVNYAVNLQDPSCIDFVNCDIEELVKPTRGNKKKKVTKKTAAMTDDEFRKLPESSWSRAIKNTCQSIMLSTDMPKIKLQHLVVAVAVETKTYAESTGRVVCLTTSTPFLLTLQ